MINFQSTGCTEASWSVRSAKNQRDGRSGVHSHQSQAESEVKVKLRDILHGTHKNQLKDATQMPSDTHYKANKQTNKEHR